MRLHTTNGEMTRKRFLGAAALTLTEGLLMHISEAKPRASTVVDAEGDFAIDSSTALLFSGKAPLVPLTGKRDAQAVWARVLPGSNANAALVYLHGNNNYVTVDRAGVSRVPDWAADDTTAKAGASAKRAAPLIYGFDRMEAPQAGNVPILLVPEDAILRTGSFWANEPSGQYSETIKLGSLINDCIARLTVLRRLDGTTMLAVKPPTPLSRVYLCGHSGAGLPLQEAAGSAIALPESGVPTDLWLFDCTYWSNVANFVHFCDQWQRQRRLAGSKSNASRFVCVYRPKTQTEQIADTLRGEIAKLLDVSADTLVKDHSKENYLSAVQPALSESGVVFIRTWLPHDEIPTFFIPRLLATSG